MSRVLKKGSPSDRVLFLYQSELTVKESMRNVMRNAVYTLLAALVLAAQVSSQHKVIKTAEAADQTQSTLALNIQSPTALQDTQAADDWETVLNNLRAAQTVERKAHQLDADLAQLRYCESHGNYAENTGNGFYGAYQYDLGTWAHFDGYARPDLAPAAVQDQKAKLTHSQRGWQPWPVCGRNLG
jgi:hypothetical protein